MMHISGLVRDGLLHLTLNDAKSRNALSLAAARELRSHLAAKGYNAVVFSAEGRVFCSGGQLSDYASMPTADQGRKVNDEIRDVLQDLSLLDCPTVACVGGDTFGGGVELLSCFDVVMAAPHAMFALWQRKIGLSFGWGGGARLEKRIGTAALRRLSLSTTALSAHEAARIGLIDVVVHEATLASQAEQTARELAALPREPFSILKTFESSREAEHFNALWWNTSHKALLASRKK